MKLKDSKMTAGIRLKLASIPRSRCSKCNTAKTYLNPVGKCHECHRKFCFDHLWMKLFKKGMRDNEEGRDVCDKCKEEHGYE